MFSRMRIPAGGQVLDDIDGHNRVRAMCRILSATGHRHTFYGNNFLLSTCLENTVVADPVE